MLTFLRKVRKSLIDSGSARKYLIYAVGEILLVMIGILLALQVNNWNENRISKKTFSQTMLGLAEDIRNDTSIIRRHISRLQSQEKAAQLIIPMLESRDLIIDTIAFYSAFLEMSTSINMDLNTEIWDDLRKSGLAKVYADPLIVERIQNYYRRYKKAARNWENETKPRIEMRGLKYELMDQSDLDKMRLANGSNLPSQNALKAIINEKQVVNLIKRIGFTSTMFANLFGEIKLLADEVLELIQEQYGTNKG